MADLLDGGDDGATEAAADRGRPPRPHYHGHRQRLRETFLEAARTDALDTVKDYELLELLLFQAIPQRDVKPLAKDLLARFGGLSGVLAAHPDDLMRVPGIKDTAAAGIKAVQAAALAMLRAEVMEKPVLSSWDRLLDYCTAAMAHRDVEQFRILFLDRKNRLIGDELQQKGTIDHTPVYPREVVKRALELKASALILVHNHPSGDPTPSRADVEMTRALIEAARPLGVVIHDHVVVSRCGNLSFKSHGLL